MTSISHRLESNQLRIGSSEDRPFRHYTRKQKIVAWISRNLFDHIKYTVRRGLLQGMKRKGGLAFLPTWLIPEELDPEERFLMSLARQNMFRGLVVYDIGSYHGLRTLFFVRHGARVVAYEPMAFNRERLEENLALNQLGGEVVVRSFALGEAFGSGTMTFSTLMTGGATLDASISEGIEQGASERVAVTTIDQEIWSSEQPAPDFLKIDVEGHELQVLLGAVNTIKQSRPTIFLELHGETIHEKREKAAALIRFLMGRGYDVYHVENSQYVTVEDADELYEGHLYCAPR